MMNTTGLPEVTVNPPSQSVEIAQRVTFTTTVSGVGEDNFSYQWRHNGEDVNEGTRSTLTMDSVTKDDSGVYECVVKNEYGDCSVSMPSTLSKLH